MGSNEGRVWVSLGGVGHVELTSLYFIANNHFHHRCKTILICFISTYSRGGFNKWVFILQEFYPSFQYSKSNKYLVFTELIYEFPSDENSMVEDELFLDEHVFLILTSGPWYGDILVYIQTMKCPAISSWEEQQKV